MTVWYHQSTILKWHSALRIAGLIAVCVAFITTLFLSSATYAAPGINQTLSFQGRLLTSAGGVVPDGYYNMQFKVYEGGTASGGGTLKWTESYVNNNANAGVNVKNGYFSVNLGSLNAFASQVNWNDDTLYLSMNIAGSAAACTAFGTSPCTADGEMTPMKRITSVPFAINSARLGGRTADGFIQNGTSPQTADFNITGTGTAASLQSSGLDTASAGTLTIGGTNATSISMADDVTVAASKSLTLVGGTTASRPASPTEGMLYYDTTTHQMLQWNGGKWVGDKTEAVIVAASDSSQADKDAANYVADGDTGTANDGDQVQINAALTAASGKKVILLAGTYTADAIISVPDNTVLAGVGLGTVIKLADLDTTVNLIENTNKTTGSGMTLQDMKLDGQDALNTAGTQYGIYLNHMGDYSAGRTGLKLLNMRIENFRSSGLLFQNSDNSIVTNTTFYGMDSGGATTAVYSDSIRHSVFSNNIFTSNTWALRFDGTGATSNTVSNNIFRANTLGVFAFAAISNAFTGNVFDSNTSAGINLYSNAAYNTISGSTFTGNTGKGIWIDDASNNEVSGNQFQSTGGTTVNNAIVISNNADRNNITGNAVTDSSCTTNCYAISITQSTADLNYLSSNSLGSNGTINDLGTGTIYSNQLDANGKLINKSTAGMSVQTSTDSATAFQVQNAAGTSALTVNTTNNSVLVAGTLDTTTATTLNIGTATATAINMGTTSGNILTTVNGRALIKSTTGNNSTTAFQVQNASSTALLTADTTNMQVVIGNGSDTITLSSSGISFAGNTRGTKQIRLAAEYQNTVLDTGATGNNSGTMVSSLDLTNRMNFYRWSATSATAQTYDIVTQVPIPQDFSAWAASNPLSITSRTSHTTDGIISLEVRDSSGTIRCTHAATQLSMTVPNWTTNTPSCLSNTGTTYTPGDYLTIRLRMSSRNSAQVDVGNIVLNYLSNK